MSEGTVDDQCVAAAQAICCLAILAQHPTNALALKELGAMTQLTEIIEDSEHNKVRRPYSFDTMRLKPTSKP